MRTRTPGLSQGRQAEGALADGSGEASPTFDALARLLLCLGERLELGTSRLPGHREHDPEVNGR